MRVIVSAPGRVCLFGEHMDWCGYSVIPAAIDMRMFAEASPLPGHIVQVQSFKPFQTSASFDLSNIRTDPASDLRYVGAVLKAMVLEKRISSENALKLRLMKGEDVSKDRSIADASRHFEDLPVKKGLSSSAALCVAAAGATDLVATFSPSTRSTVSSPKSTVDKTIDNNLTRYANLAYMGERKILGINCGQMDQYASAYGGILFIDCRKEPAEVRRLKIRKSIPLVIGDTNQQKDTPRILEWLGGRFRKQEELLMEGVKGIVNVVLEARKELDNTFPNLKKVGELMNMNQLYLSENLRVSGECPISPSNLDKLIDASLDAGALGAKVTGSGGGGCIIALCKDEMQRGDVAKAIAKAGGKAYATKIAPVGLRVELVES